MDFLFLSSDHQLQYMATLINFPIGLPIRMARMLLDLIYIFEVFLE